jgi:hypothetical protein
MAAVRRTLALTALAALVAACASLAAEAKPGPTTTFTLKISQGPTFRHPHPPDGDANDQFSTTLTLFTIGSMFDKPDNTKVGAMTFAYVLHGTCSSTGESCRGTADITTSTRLPGGTISASGKAIPLHVPFLVPIRSGTGRYKGATGVIQVAPNGAPRNIYKIKLP